MLKSFVMDSGERYCLHVDDAGIPSYYPNLYITTQVRNRSLSFSAMESTLGGISVLYRHLRECNENLIERFYEGRFLDESELDLLRDFCQSNLKAPTTNKVFAINQQEDLNDKVSSATEYTRLTVIANYLKWLAEQVSPLACDRNTALQINKMVTSLKSRRPVRKTRNSEITTKGLTHEQLQLLFELLRPESELNPFKSESIRIRNRLIFLILYHLGIRGGELLNIRIRDIDFSSNELVVFRRPDEMDDPRKDQPLVKTLDRRLPMKDTLAKEIHLYITKERKAVTNASKNDFLFVTHKPGPTQGQPLSKSSYKKIIDIVRNSSPSLSTLSGHQLRHAWNEAFSEHMDSMNNPPSEEVQEKIRSALMGWREGSGTATSYNKRFIRRQANEASMKLQEDMIRLPDGMNNEK